MSRKKRAAELDRRGTPEAGPFHSPFAALAPLRETLPAQKQRERPSTAQRGPGRAVVRYERKGRGGKEATVVEQLALSPPERGEWLQAMKQALGCGGTLEGEALVLQGDQRTRVRAWLEARGVVRISIG